MLTLRALAPLILVLTAAALYCLFRAIRALAFVARSRDADIDILIAQNAYRYRAGMDRIDWQRTDKAGERVWQATLRAQRKERAQPKPGGRLLSIADRCR